MSDDGVSRFLGKVTQGDCLELMRELPDNYIDSVITDPPYGLSNHSTEDVSECLACWIKGEPYTQSKKGFMGKAWDGWVPGPEVWKECYRVLKPGGTILCFAGSRTQDLMGMALRLSGFEIFDAIFWNFGQGFPKSHSISKALDARAGEVRTEGQREWRGGQRHSNTIGGGVVGNGTTTLIKYDTPVSELAKQFDGYGTALKPSYEIILMGRKPCDGTFAQNAEKWGIAGLNIDGGRISLEEGDVKTGGFGLGNRPFVQGAIGNNTRHETTGRWPANTILSCFCEGEHAEDCPVRIMDEQSGVSKSGSYKGEGSKSGGIWSKSTGKPAGPEHGDTGGASRFFYQVKKDKVCLLCGETIIETGDTNCNVNCAEKSLSQNINHKDTAPESAEDLSAHAQEAVSEKFNIHVKHVAESLKSMLETSGCIVAESVLHQVLKQTALNAKYAGNLCETCGINIAAALVEAKLIAKSQNAQKASVFLTSMPDALNYTLTQNIVSFAEMMASIDTIPTTKNLSLLFGSVRLAIEKFTKQEYLKQNGSSGPTRFLYTVKPSRSEKEAGLEGFDKNDCISYTEAAISPVRDNRKTIKVANNHATVKPISLMRYLCKLTRPPHGGIVLDPFTGSGTTGIAAILEGRDFIGFELSEEYVDIANARIAYHKNLNDEKSEVRETQLTLI